MATTEYHPDPYNGWRVVFGCGNVTAHEIMNDTSGRWQMTRNYGSLRVYSQC